MREIPATTALASHVQIPAVLCGWKTTAVHGHLHKLRPPTLLLQVMMAVVVGDVELPVQTLTNVKVAYLVPQVTRGCAGGQAVMMEEEVERPPPIHRQVLSQTTHQLVGTTVAR